MNLHTNISQSILDKLNELENNPLVPYMWTQNVYCPAAKQSYEETEFIHFDKGLYGWALNFFGGNRYYASKIELEISDEFAKWLSNFKRTTKDNLVEQLLKENRDILQLRCKRDNIDWVEPELKIKQNILKCFKKLK